MSYTIVYDSIFIKSPNGYTVCVLAGDNNVYETERKRAREWHCWLFDKSESDIRAYYAGCLGEKYQQHFKRNNKWVDDKGLLRWIDNGIKNARTIEEILEFKPRQNLCCMLKVYKSIEGSEKSKKVETAENVKQIYTNADFEDWCKIATERLETQAQNEKVYPLVFFRSDEPLKLGKKTTLKGKVIATFRGKNYISKISENGEMEVASSDISKAIVFESIEEARRVLKSSADIRFINAENAFSKDSCIAVYKDDADSVISNYISRVTKAGIYTTMYKEYARKYSEKAAHEAIKRYKKRFLNANFKIEKI